MGAKPLYIRFGKIDGSIKVDMGLDIQCYFGDKKYGSICNRVRYLVRVNGGIPYITSHKVDSCEPWFLKKKKKKEKLLLP